YTGGRLVPGVDSIVNDSGIITSPDGGGSVRIGAGRDIVGSVTTQAPADWQSRRIVFDENGVGEAYWGVDFSAFKWNVGALGGGDVSLVSGRDTLDLSAATVESESLGPDGERLQLGGGNLNVTTGRNLASSLLYVGRGMGTVHADGALSSSGNRRLS